MPDAPLAWFIVAAIAGAVTYALRKVIIVGGAIVAALALYFSDKDDSDTSGEAVSTASADPIPVQPEGLLIHGLCLSNLTGSHIAVTVTTEPGATGDPLVLTSNEQGKFWRAVDDDSDRAYVKIAEAGNDPPHDLATSFLTLINAEDVTAADLSCGGGGLPDYEIRHDSSGYRITPA